VFKDWLLAIGKGQIFYANVSMFIDERVSLIVVVGGNFIGNFKKFLYIHGSFKNIFDIHSHISSILTNNTDKFQEQQKISNRKLTIDDS
jgi:hypothetical protein